MESDAEPWIPIPRKTWRWWLLLLLAVLQVGQFFAVDFCFRLRKWFLIQSIQVYPNEENEIWVAAYLGMAMALGGNLAFILAKARLGILPRLILVFMLWSGAVAGFAPTFESSFVPFVSGFLAIISLAASLGICGCWALLPGLARRRLIHLQEPAELPPESRHLRLIHFFYLILAAAALSSVYRFLSDSFLFLSKNPSVIPLLVIAAFAIATGVCVMAILVQSLSLTSNSVFYFLPLSAALILPLAFAQSYLINRVAGGSGGDSDLLFMYLRANLMAYCLLVGSGFALRLLGYRLVRA